VRSALFTPGTEADRLRKAVGTGADACIFDLEDSVPPSRVGEARQIVRAALEELGGRARIWVRVHPASNPAMADDLTALPLEKADGVMLPKAGGAHDLAACRTAIDAAKGPADMPLIPIIESAAGVVNIAEIATIPTVFCLAFGRLDLSADLSIDPETDNPAVAAARAAVVLHSRAADLHPALESPWVKIKDLDGLEVAAQRARSDGFGGMLVIHPSHLELINQVFSPTKNELAWARAIVESADAAAAQGRAAYAMKGEMVDEAIIRRARSILDDAQATVGRSHDAEGTR
jgi:citrate lyase beta subunit